MGSLNLSRVIGFIFLLIMESSTIFLQAAGKDSLNTNSELFRYGIGSLVDSLMKKTSVTAGSSVIVNVRSSEEQSFVEQVIVSTLRLGGFEVYLNSEKSTTTYSLNVSGVELSVSYGEAFHEAFLGETKSQRTVSVTLPLTLNEERTGKVIQSETLHFQASDTVCTDRIPLLEHRQLPSTQAELPKRSFFDKLVEPIVIIGATGVAIFLFFHVRS